MKEYFEKSLRMIRNLNISLTREQYYQIAKKFKLLSPDSLEYIARKDFAEIVAENIINERLA